MPTTTTTPATAGTTYPLPPRPSWHPGPADVDDGSLMYDRELGQINVGSGPEVDPEDDAREIVAVYLCRRDWMDPESTWWCQPVEICT
jgi:hypothetical protein